MPVSLRSRCRSRRLAWSRWPLLAVLALLSACGGGGSGGGSVSSGGNGSVAVLVTDGPVDPDDFSHIFVTFSAITLIGPDGQVEIFDGEETLDLRELEDASTLVTLGRDVPAGHYEKIRLDVSEIELVPADGGPSIFPKLPPKIDLNPRGSFVVEPGELLLVQIDMDAGKSIHVVETGHGGFRFRPVIFVDILNGAHDGKLVLLRGVVDEVGDDSLLLCETHPVSKPLGATRSTERRHDDDDDDDQGEDEGEDDDDHGEDDDHCAEVAVDADTSLFDASADPIELADVEAGDQASVLGRFLRDGDEDLDFLAEVVLLGDDVLAVDGEVSEEVDAQDRFELELDPGQGIVTDDGLLRVQLQDGTKLFERSGDPLDPEDIAVGDAARAVGVLALSSSSDDLLKAAWVMLRLAAADVEAP